MRVLVDGEEVEVLEEVIPFGRTPITIERPKDPGSLIQGWCERADPAVQIPYWAEIWPASLAIVKRLEEEGTLEGRSVLDLGCGLGLVGIAAGLLGGRVSFADYHPDALEFARRNVRVAGLTHAEFLLVDWRSPGWARPFDLVLGADVIYERSEHEPIADLLRVLLQGGGKAWLGEPSRDTAKLFLEDWTSRGRRAHSVRAEAATVHELSL